MFFSARSAYIATHGLRVFYRCGREAPLNAAGPPRRSCCTHSCEPQRQTYNIFVSEKTILAVAQQSSYRPDFYTITPTALSLPQQRLSIRALSTTADGADAED